jgi:hypothetical protein
MMRSRRALSPVPKNIGTGKFRSWGCPERPAIALRGSLVPFQRLGGSFLGSLPLEYKRPAGERISPKRFGKSRPHKSNPRSAGHAFKIASRSCGARARGSHPCSDVRTCVGAMAWVGLGLGRRGGGSGCNRWRSPGGGGNESILRLRLRLRVSGLLLRLRTRVLWSGIRVRIWLCPDDLWLRIWVGLGRCLCQSRCRTCHPSSCSATCRSVTRVVRVGPRVPTPPPARTGPGLCVSRPGCPPSHCGSPEPESPAATRTPAPPQDGRPECGAHRSRWSLLASLVSQLDVSFLTPIRCREP